VERNSDHNGTSVQAYLGWQNSDISQAISVSVAGYMTSHRCEGNCICILHKGNQHIQVIEIPLKGEVTAFSLNRYTGEIIVAVGRHVLVYGLSCKIAASTGRAYRELKCLLDLQFTFVVQYIDYYGDYFLCASHGECQLVHLNKLTISDDSVEEIQVTQRGNSNPRPDVKFCTAETPSDAVDSFLDWVENPNLNDNYRNYIVKDSNFLEWDFAEEISFSSSLESANCLKQTPKNIHVPSLQGIKNGQQTDHSRQIIVVGPDSTKPMPEVVVEYEGEYEWMVK